VDEQGKMLTTNSRASGRFHSNWLSMIYPRLLIAWQLLRDDGVICVSIDDNEVHHLKLMLNEVFGEENFFTAIVVQSNKRGQTYKQIAKTHEYVLIYTKTPDVDLNELEKEGESDDLNLTDDISAFNIRELRNRNPKFGRFNRPNLYFPIYVNPKVVDKDGFSPIALEKGNGFTVEVLPLDSNQNESCWRWGKELTTKNIGAKTLNSNVVAKQKKSGEYGIYEKYRKTTYKAKSIWFENEVITEKGTIELGKLGLSEFFDFPKPIFLIKKLIMLATDKEDDIVLDFFAGSGTTAHAVLELNQEDGGTRQFVVAQIQEATHKAKFPTIADVSRERIRRAIKDLKAKREGQLELERKQDLGFKSYKLDRSNFKEWDSLIKHDETVLQLRFDEAESPLVAGWTPENLLAEILLLQGFPLDSRIRPLVEFKANRVLEITSEFCQHRLYVCLDPKIQPETVQSLKLRPEDILVALDSALTDEAKITLADQVNLKVI